MMTKINFGALSLILGGVALALFLINAGTVLLNIADNPSVAPTPLPAETPAPEDSPTPVIPLANAYDARLVLVGLLSLAANALGVAFGVGGLFQQNEPKAFAVSGLTLNALLLLMYCCLMMTAIPVG